MTKDVRVVGEAPCLLRRAECFVGAQMLKILHNPTYRFLFLAQIASLLGTGLTTVALGLLAYDLAGPDAGAVLGTALAIKMIAYVGMAPIASVVAERLPRRAFLIGLDVLRSVIVLFLSFVDQVWQIYVLIFVLQSASAAFTPAFQATIPDVLPDEADYTKALSLSRLAYDLENLLSPTLELCVNLGDGLSGQAAAFSRPASMPSVNLTPVISFGN